MLNNGSEVGGRRKIIVIGFLILASDLGAEDGK